MRRVAAHIVNIGDRTLHQAVVEIDHGHVVACYEFDQELAATEWLGGTIDVVAADDGSLSAFHTPESVGAGSNRALVGADSNRARLMTISHEQSRSATAQEESCADTQQEGIVRVLLR